MPPSIIIDHLSKQYRLNRSTQETMIREKLVNLWKHPLSFRGNNNETIWALKDVCLGIDEGEIVGIIGSNGAGKSTLLKVLSRITHPTSGTIKVHGRVASLLEVGTGFHEELTGRENVFLNGSILGMNKKETEAKLDAIVAFAGVEKFIDTPVKRYSSGMCLRLGFAVAAHLDPDVLILDEVLAVGDAAFQKKCLRAMEDLRNSGRTVLFVSHNLAAVENLCSRGIWIDHGQIRKDGDTQAVIESYMAAFGRTQQVGSDLSCIERRRGSGEIRYTAIEFLNSAGQPKKTLRSGDSMTVRLYFHAEKPIPSPSMGFRLATELGTLVTDTSTWHHGIEIPIPLPGDGYVDLEIDCLNLLCARYYFSLWLIDTDTNRVYDCLEHCVSLEIEPSDIYQSGRAIDSRFGIVFFPQRWKLDGLYSGRKFCDAVSVPSAG